MLVRNCKRKRDKTQAQMIDIKIDATDNNWKAYLNVLHLHLWYKIHKTVTQLSHSSWQVNIKRGKSVFTYTDS
jgi:hypothetical protein